MVHVDYYKAILLNVCRSLWTHLLYIYASCAKIWQKYQKETEKVTPISVLDAVWLEMKSDINTSVVINSVLHLQDKMTREKLNHLAETNLHRFKKFRCAIEQPARSHRVWDALMGKPRPILKEVPYDDAYHVTREVLPQDHQDYDAALGEMLNKLGNELLDDTKPLWRIHIIDSEDELKGSAVMIRIHHSIGDGMALVRLLFSLTTEEADGKTTPSLHLIHGGKAKSGPTSTTTTPQQHKTEGVKALFKRYLGYAALFIWVIVQIFKAMKKLLFSPPDTRTVLKGPLNPEKQMAYIDLDLKEVKEVGKAQQCTVNDVLVSVVSAALRQYLCAQQQPGLKEEDKNFDINKTQIHAVVPFSLRPWSAEIELDNNFSLLYLPLPIDEVDPQKRTQRISQTMNTLKTSLEPYVSYYTCHLLFLGPMKNFLRQIFEHFSDKATLILTNVPGPQQQLYFAGSRIDMLRFFVPQGAKLSLGISIFSYAGKVSVGLCADKGLVPNPERMAQYCSQEFDQLKQACNVH